MKNYKIVYKFLRPNALYIEDMMEIKCVMITLDEAVAAMQTIKADPEHYELISLEKLDTKEV